MQDFGVIVGIISGILAIIHFYIVHFFKRDVSKKNEQNINVGIQRENSSQNKATGGSIINNGDSNTTTYYKKEKE